MRVGYQGIPDSNSEKACIDMLDILKKEAEMVPLVTPKGVMDALLAKEIDYGVLAVKNNTAGIVMESFQEVIDNDVDTIFAQIQPIHHCLFVKNEQIQLQDITTVASHPQAISQCRNNLKNLLPRASSLAMEDTALAAKKLSIGEYSDYTAVLCTERAGVNLGLHLLEKDFEDYQKNATEFRMFRLHKASPSTEAECDLEGYWKYTVTEFENEDINIQDKYGTPRLVRIKHDEKNLALEAWELTSKPANRIYFEFKKLEMEGEFPKHLVYEYRHNPDHPASGIAELDFAKPAPKKGVCEFYGNYRNYLNAKQGLIHYVRISKGDYFLLKNSQFLL